MFDDKRKVAETLVGPSVRVEGTLVGTGDVVVEGHVIGTLKTDKSVIIGEQAKLKADIQASDVSVAGEVRGNIKATGKLVLAASARIYGNVEAVSLSVADGAVLHGKCTMVNGKEPDVTEATNLKRANYKEKESPV